MKGLKIYDQDWDFCYDENDLKSEKLIVQKEKEIWFFLIMEKKEQQPFNVEWMN